MGMKKWVLLLMLVSFLLCSCGSRTEVSLGDVVRNGLGLEKGMTRQQVISTLKRRPDTIEKFDNVELWIYEGVIPDKENDDQKRYENLTIKFVNGQVAYVGYFSCKLPSK